MNILLNPADWTPAEFGTWTSDPPQGYYTDGGDSALLMMRYIGAGWAPGDTVAGRIEHDESEPVLSLWLHEETPEDCVFHPIAEGAAPGALFDVELPPYNPAHTYWLGYDTGEPSSCGSDDGGGETARGTAIRVSDDPDPPGEICYPPVCSCTLPAC